MYLSFFLLSWSVRLQSLNSLRSQHMFISLVHIESTTAFWWENLIAWERGTQRLLAGNTQQLSREKSNSFQREKHNYQRENTTIGGKNTKTIGGKNTIVKLA
jgi:hypothetical protein